MRIIWTCPAINVIGTALVGYVPPVGTFEETVARLIAASGQRSFPEDLDKISVLFTGYLETASGRLLPFTIYDYKNDDRLHIGAHEPLPVGFWKKIEEVLRQVEPVPYTAARVGGGRHGFGVSDLDPVVIPAAYYDADGRRHVDPTATAGYRIGDEVVLDVAAPGTGRLVYRVTGRDEEGNLRGRLVQSTARELSAFDVV